MDYLYFKKTDERFLRLSGVALIFATLITLCCAVTMAA